MPEGRLAAVIDDPGFEPVRVEPVSAGGATAVRLRGTATIKLTVAMPGHGNLAAYSVGAARSQPGSNSRFAPLHDGLSALPGGELHGLPPGDHEISVRSDMGLGKAIVSSLGAAETRAVDVQLTPMMRISSSVAREDGNPVPGAPVCLMLPAAENDSEHSQAVLYPNSSCVPPTWRRCVQRRQTFSDGAFSFEVQEPGRYLLVTGNQGGPQAWSQPIEVTPDFTLEGGVLSLPTPARFNGRLVLPPHLPQGRWVIQAVMGDGTGGSGLIREPATVDSLGHFQFTDLAPGRIEFYLRPASSSLQFSGSNQPWNSYSIGSVTFESGSEVDRTMTVAGPIPGVVRIDPHPAEGVGGQLRVVLREVGAESTIHQRFTNGSMESVPPIVAVPGRYLVHFLGPGWSGYQHEPITVEENSSMNLTIPVEPLQHRVRVMQNGQPLGEQKLLIHPAIATGRSPEGLRVTTDVDGWCEPGLTAGSWTLVVLDGNPFSTTRAEVEIAWPPAAVVIDV